MNPSCVDSSQAALEHLSLDPQTNLVIIDAGMPDISGNSFTRIVSDKFGNRRIRTILLSWVGQRPECCADEGVFGLNKPIRKSLLKDLLVRVVGHEQDDLAEPEADSEEESLLSEELPLDVLVAEDNVVNQKLISRMLHSLGYRPDIVSNGVEVLEAIERRKYDVVLMDVHMPERDGLETARLIRRKKEQGHEMPVCVAMTAALTEEDRERCLRSGMDEILPKPFRTEALSRILRAAFDQPDGAAVDRDTGAPADLRAVEPGIRLRMHKSHARPAIALRSPDGNCSIGSRNSRAPMTTSSSTNCSSRITTRRRHHTPASCRRDD